MFVFARWLPLSFLTLAMMSPPTLFAQATNGSPPSGTTPPAASPSEETTPTPIETPTATEELTKDSIQQRIAAVNASTELDEGVKAEVVKNLQNSLVEIDRKLAAKKATEAFKKTIADAPAEIEAAKKARQEDVKDPPQTAVKFAEQIGQIQSVSELEKLLQEKQQQLKDVSSAFTQTDAAPKARVDRTALIQAELAANKAELEQLTAAMAVAPTETPPGPETLAKMAYQQKRREALNAVQERLQAELDSFKATADLLPLKLDSLAVDKVRLEKQVAALTERANSLRKMEAEKQVEEKKEQAKTVAPELAPLAEQITKLAEVQKETANNIAVATTELDKKNKQYEDIKKAYAETQKQTESAGLSAQAGQLLRHERESLPDITTLQRNIQDRDELLGTARFTNNDYQSKRLEFADLEEKKISWINKLREENPAFELTESLENQLDELLTQQRELTAEITTGYSNYITYLTQLNETERSLIDETRAYADYIRERVLWIRSTYPLSPREIKPAPEAFAWLIRPANWLAAAEELRTDISRRPELWFVFLIVVLVLFAFQRPVRRWLIRQSDIASRRSAMEFLPTLKVLGYSLFLASLVPVVLWFIGWRLSSSFSSVDFVRALSSALLASSAYCFAIETLRHLMRRKGLVQSHLDWDFDRLPAIRRTLLVSLWVNLPLWFVVILLEDQTQNILWSSSLGRICFLGLMVTNIGFVMSLFNPGRNPQPPIFATWSTPLKWATICSICAITVLALIGYYETALVLTGRVFRSIMLIIGLAILNGVFARLVLVNRRRIAVEQARIRREAQSQASETPTAPGSVAARNVTDDLIDLSSATAQTRKFIRTATLLVGMLALWQVWESVLPALNQIVAYTYTDGRSLHFGDLIFVAFSLVVTYLIATNLPGFIELSILGHLPLDKGIRYAISTLSSYLVTIIGVVIACSAVNLKWESVQWLVAALSVGLGFGLQEIFANFVSGMILLFERPIRVGDIVTLGNTTGLVSRIRIRSTTITDWDEKEYIVPNKDLITGSILNWTLSSTRNRVVINIGVGYNSDTRKVRRLLEEIIREHETILKEPKPLVNFDGFGDSTLNFVARFYLASLDGRINIIDEIHNQILERFRLENVEIAFPQRDLHIRTWPANMPAPPSESAQSKTFAAESNGATSLHN